MRTGAAPPRCSWTLGPAGTAGGAGGAPRAEALNRHRTAPPSSSQSQGFPQAALMDASLRGRTRPSAVSMTHASMPL